MSGLLLRNKKYIYNQTTDNETYSIFCKGEEQGIRECIMLCDIPFLLSIHTFHTWRGGKAVLGTILSGHVHLAS